MLTINQFVTKHNGKFLDYDGYYGGQCVDLVQYWAQNLGTPRFAGNAINIFDQPGTKYTAIKKTLTNYPKAGDIMVWGTMPGNPYGHTAVVISANLIGFTSFDQNWPPNSPCHKQYHSYLWLRGWLRPNVLSGSGVNNVTEVQNKYNSFVYLHRAILNVWPTAHTKTKYMEYAKAGKDPAAWARTNLLLPNYTKK